MYQIIIDNHDGKQHIIHDSRSNNIRVNNAVCDLELNKTGTLSFKINPKHPYFSEIYKHKTEVYLYQDKDCLFCGRVLNDETDIYNFKTIVCEGMMAYLLDSIQRAESSSFTGDNKIRDYITDVINIHNNQVDDHKKFSVGLISEVDSSETFYKISSYDDTLTTLNKDLVGTFNHTYLMCEVKNGNKIINYRNSNGLPKNNQVIRFGKNLLKLNKNVKGEEIATAIIPLGTTINSKETDNGTVDYKLTIESLPEFTDGTIKHDANTDYIYDEKAVELYGKIFKVINYDSVEKAQNLLDNAVKQLKYYSELTSIIEITAFDLHLLNVNYNSFRIGQEVKVVSKIHDLDDYLIVQKITIYLDNPENTTIVLSDEKRISVDTNVSSSKKTNEVNDKLDNLEKDLNSDYYINKDYFNTPD